MRDTTRCPDPPARTAALSFAVLPAFAVALALAGCAGDASDGEAPAIEFSNSSECIRFDGGFPSGLTLLPGDGGEAAVGQLTPTAVLGLDLDREPPRLLARDAIPSFPEVPCGRCGGLARVDSDSDGEADACRSDALGYRCFSPVAGDLYAVDAGRVALSTSGYEQIVFVDPGTSRLLPVELDTPPASTEFEPADWPFWPAPGEQPVRTAISTRACVYVEGAVDSTGVPVGPSTSCDGLRAGFATGFTAGVARARGRLFAATSNLTSSSRARFDPGTLLVFDYDDTLSPPRAGPSPVRSVILLSGFNPTGVTAYRTPAGRDLVLVGLTGAIAIGTGSDLVRSDSAIDVIDAESLTLIATIPLGRAGLGFSELAIDASRRIALSGAATTRALFGIDLAALDDPDLGLGPDPLPIALDGSSPPFPDARLFTASDPFALPRRPDGPSPDGCATQTSVALSRGSELGVASDFCDGSLSVLAVELPASRTAALDPAAVLRVERVQNVAAPLVAENSDRLRAIDRVLIRPGIPGIDFDGPDVYFSAGLPEAAVCGTNVNAID